MARRRRQRADRSKAGLVPLPTVSAESLVEIRPLFHNSHNGIDPRDSSTSTDIWPPEA